MYIATALLALTLVAHGDSTDLFSDLERQVGAEAWQVLHQQPEAHGFFDALRQNEDWLREVLDSGPLLRPEKVLGFLQLVWNSERDLGTRPVDRSMATACALTLGFTNRAEDAVLQRYHYYRDSFRAGLLNSCYGGLATWERRFLARGTQWGDMANTAAMLYLRDRICWPRREYVSACWQAPYRSFNCLDDSVQRSTYYMPFRESFGAMPEMVIEVGGVCGALSNLGASAAMANGIPAATMGEPGHCAYTVKISDTEWKPAYSLSWKRSLHTSFYDGTWQSLMLTEACFSDSESVARAADLARAAHALEREGELDKANEQWAKALKAHGLHYGLWMAWADFGERTAQGTAWWARYQHALLDGLQGHEGPAWGILSRRVYPKLFAELEDAAKLRTLLKWIRNQDHWGAGRWNVEGAWDWAFKQLDEESQSKLESTMCKILISSPDFGPPLVAWLLGKHDADSAEGKATLARILAASSDGGEGGSAVLKKLARSALLDAAARGDVPTFQIIGAQTARLSEPKDMSGIKPFPGDLVSAGGLLQVSGRGNRWDTPETHWGILGEHGGRCHTDNGASFIAVRLEHHTEITGIVIQNVTGGQAGRAAGSRVEISTDGETWEQVGVLKGTKGFYSLDLEAKKHRALWVRMAKDTNCLHVTRFLVWGHRRS